MTARSCAQSRVGGPAALIISDFNGARVHVSGIALATECYAIFITSTNRTAFVMGIRATWSLFYVLRVYVNEGVFVSIAGALAFSYFRYFERRRAVEEEVVREAQPHGETERTLRLPAISP